MSSSLESLARHSRSKFCLLIWVFSSQMKHFLIVNSVCREVNCPIVCPQRFHSPNPTFGA
jgi:hypothetical protein